MIRAPRSLAVCALALVLFPCSLHAANIETIAISGGAVPSATGAVFKSFGEPVIAVNGDVAFDAKLMLGAGGGGGSNVPGLSVRNIYATVSPGSITDAEAIISDPSKHQRVVAEIAPVINYHGLGGTGHYSGDSPFPGDTTGGTATNFVIEATATINIPTAGNWTFGVNSDDGFKLTVGSNTLQFPNGRGSADTVGTFNFPNAGDYSLRLVYFQGTQGYTLEMWAAQGSTATWNSNFRLVGDSANGGLSVSSPPLAVTSATDAGIYRKRTGSSLEKIARTGDAAPTFDGAGISFGSLQPPVIDSNGNVAFLGALAIDNNKVHTYDDQGIWTSGNTPGELFFITRENYRAIINYDGTLIPWENGPPLYDQVGNPAISRNGLISFRADLKSFPAATYNNTRGIWYRSRPTSPIVFLDSPLLGAWSNLTAPGTADLFASFRTPLFGDNTQSVFQSTTSNADPLASEGIWSGVPSTLSLLTRAGAPAPGVSGAPLMFDLGAPAANSQGQFAFWGGVNHPTASEGIWARKFGTTSPLALAGTAAPGVNGSFFSHFYDPLINERGQCAVLGYLKMSNGQPAPAGQDHGIWTGGANSYLRLVVKAGDTAPGTSGLVFRNISSPRLNELGQIAFLAEVGAPNVEPGTPGDLVGIWAMDVNGSLMLIALEGQTVNVGSGDNRTLATVSLSDFSDAGDLAVKATFTNGSSAILRAGIAPPALIDYAQWRQQNIPSGQPGEPHEDADHDGISNAMEMALGLNPTVSDNIKAPTIGLISAAGAPGSVEALTFTYRRRINQNTLTYTVMVSPNLTDWTPASASATQLDSKLLGGAMEEIVLRVPTLGLPRYFVRLQVDFL